MNSSTKKLYTYISLTLILAYFVFILWMYNSNQLNELYDIKQVGFYYIFAYILFVGVGYMIDTQTKREPAFITLFTIPSFSFILLLGMFIMDGVFWLYYVLLCLIILLLYILGYLCYKKWISKVITLKIGYENILFIYIIIHIFVVLIVAFSTMNLL